MPLAGKGMLLTSMDIAPSDEAEFNRWYDREHLEERVTIQGFLEARRYVAHDGTPKYLSLYSTETFEVLDSPAYRTALANQTDWWPRPSRRRFAAPPAMSLRSRGDEGIERYLTILEAISATAFITASRTPGSYSVWPAPSTKRISASRHTAASACEVAGGHSRS